MTPEQIADELYVELAVIMSNLKLICPARYKALALIFWKKAQLNETLARNDVGKAPFGSEMTDFLLKQKR